MSEKKSSTSNEVPKIKLGLQEKYKKEKKAEPEPLKPENIKKQKEQLPDPSGWRLLVLPFTPKEKTKGGIIIAQESLEKLRIATNCGYVLKVGPLAYQDTAKFGPAVFEEDRAWCKEGDWICIGRYAGSRFSLEDMEVRVINDDEVIATLLDPEDIKHI